MTFGFETGLSRRKRIFLVKRYKLLLEISWKNANRRGISRLFPPISRSFPRVFPAAVVRDRFSPRETPSPRSPTTIGFYINRKPWLAQLRATSKPRLVISNQSRLSRTHSVALTHPRGRITLDDLSTD